MNSAWYKFLLASNRRVWHPLPGDVLLVTGLLWLGACSYAQAAFINVDDPDFGVGSVVLDQNTGLEWLRMEHTTLSPEQLAMLDTGSGVWSR